MPTAFRKGVRGLASVAMGGGAGGGAASFTSKSAGGGVAPAAPDATPGPPAGPAGPPAAGGVFTPGNTRSIKARANVRAGIYEGNPVRIIFRLMVLSILDSSYLPPNRLFTNGWL